MPLAPLRPRVASLLLLLSATGWAADLSLLGVDQPSSGCGLNATESVSVRIFNHGPNVPAGTNLSVRYSVNGGLPVSEQVTLPVPLVANSTWSYTFTTPINLSTPGSYSVTASVSLPGDPNPANDTANRAVTNTALSVGGTLSGPTSVCAQANSGTLLLSGHTGQVESWEVSNDGGNSWLTLSNTTTAQGFSNLSVPTLYRAVVRNGSCPSARSTILSVGIDSPTVGGAVGPATSSVCTGANSGTLVLSGRTGSVTRWELSTDEGVTWVPIANTTGSQSYANLTTSTRYRARVQSGSCPASFSAPAVITVSPTSVGGSVTGTIACEAGTLELSGQRGAVVRWEASTDQGVTWSPLSGTSASLAVTGVAVPTMYRARVQSGVCPVVFSSPTTLVPDGPRPEAVLDAPPWLCSGTEAFASVAADGGTILWTLGGATAISPVSEPSLRFLPVSSTSVALGVTVARGPQCSASAQVSIPVRPAPASTITAPAQACAGQVLRASVPPTTGARYFWTVQGGTIVGSASSREIDFVATGAGPARLSALVLGQSCTATSGHEVAVDALTAAAPRPSSNSPLCEGETLQLEGPPGASSYLWTGPNGFSSTDRLPQVASVGAAAQGRYELTVSSGACTGPTGQTEPVVVRPRPAEPRIEVTGPLAPLSAQNVARTRGHVGSTFAWSATGATITRGQGDEEVEFSVDVDAGQVELRVVETSWEGCASMAGALALTVMDPDGGCPVTDGGCVSEPLDAGTDEPDAGTETPDAGLGGLDGGPGSVPDERGGCGCSSGSGVLAMFSVLTVLLRSRRRRTARA